MANQQLYTLAYVTVQGKLLTEEANVTITRQTGSQAVNTVVKGYAGESPGAATVEIEVTNAVPAADFEYNAQEDMESLNFVEIGLIVAGKQLIAKGAIIKDTFKHSINTESNYDFSFRGGFAKFE